MVFGGKAVCMGDGGVAAATAAALQDQDTMVTVPRCPATFLLEEAVRPYRCRACARRYHPPGTPGAVQQHQPQPLPGLTADAGAPSAPAPQVVDAQGAAAVPGWPLCVFCGIAAGPAPLAVQLALPCALPGSA